MGGGVDDIIRLRGGQGITNLITLPILRTMRAYKIQKRTGAINSIITSHTPDRFVDGCFRVAEGGGFSISSV